MFSGLTFSRKTTLLILSIQVLIWYARTRKDLSFCLRDQLQQSATLGQDYHVLLDREMPFRPQNP